MNNANTALRDILRKLQINDPAVTTFLDTNYSNNGSDDDRDGEGEGDDDGEDGDGDDVRSLGTSEEDDSDLNTSAASTNSHFNGKLQDLIDARVGSRISELTETVALLQAETRRKDALIDKLQKDSILNSSQAAEQLADLARAKHMLQASAEAELKQQQDAFRQHQQRTTSEMEHVRGKLLALERQNPLIVDRIARLKSELADMQLPDDRYIDLRSRDPEQLSVKDFVLLKVYEHVRPYKEEQHHLRCQAAELKERVDMAEELLREKQAELLRAADLAARNEARNKEEIALLKSQKGRLQEELASQMTLAEQLAAKASLFDELRQRYERMEESYHAANNQSVVKEAECCAAIEGRQLAEKRFADAQQLLELIKMDKVYLAKDADTARAQLQRLQTQQERQSLKVRDLKRAKEELFQQVLKAREEQKGNYEARLQTEVERIRAETSQHLNDIKASARDVSEREVRSMREQRDLAQGELSRVLAKLNDTRAAYEDLQKEYRVQQGGADSKLSEITGQLKLRAFELERTQLAYEEAQSNVKQAGIELEKNRKKVGLLTAEYYNLDSRTKARIAQLETLVQEKDEKLLGYEALESDLDSALLDAAKGGTIENTALFAAGVPAGVVGNRRMKQVLKLSKRVVELERLNAELAQQLQDRDAVIQQLTAELSTSRDLLRKTAQPYNFMVESIQQRDAQLLTERSANSQLQARLRDLTNQHKLLEQEKEQWTAQHERLAAQHSHLEHLRHTVSNLQRQIQGGKETIFIANHVSEHEEGRHCMRSPGNPTAAGDGDNDDASSSGGGGGGGGGASRPYVPVAALEISGAPSWYRQLRSTARH